MKSRFLFFLAALLSILTCFPCYAYGNSSSYIVPAAEALKPAAASIIDEVRERAAEAAKNPAKIRVVMSFAGDCTLGSDLKYGKSGSFIEVFEKQSQPYDYFFSNVKSIFEDDDLTIVNLEGPLTNLGVKAEKEFAFRGLPEYTGILKGGSVEIVNLANNHTYDYGERGYTDTIKNLDGADIASYGVEKPYIAHVNGVKIGFLGYKSLSTDTGYKNRIANDIKELRESGANAVIVTFHCGIEGDYFPSAAQKTLYRHGVDSGADMVAGHHPHVVQGIELYNGKYIVYSMGNFSFGGNRNPSDKDTFIFRQTLEFDGKTFEKTGASAEIVPCAISSIPNRNDFRPTPLAGEQAARLLSKINRISHELNKNIDITEAIGVYVKAGD